MDLINSHTFKLSEAESISIVWEGSTGRISSNLKVTVEDNADNDLSTCEECLEFNASIDGMESLILAYACAGGDITSIMFEDAVRSSYAAITHEYF